MVTPCGRGQRPIWLTSPDAMIIETVSAGAAARMAATRSVAVMVAHPADVSVMSHEKKRVLGGSAGGEAGAAGMKLWEARGKTTIADSNTF